MRTKRSSRVRVYYPKPGPIGGKLIREVIGFLRASQVQLPLASHILIAVSGGSDSTALAHLLCRYGRRVGKRAKIRLLHVNHRWRGAESDADERFVRELGKRLGVKVLVIRLKAPTAEAMKGLSWEDHARKARKRIYARESAALSRPGSPAVVLTAHQSNDLAETLIWRLLTGAAATHGGGIAVKNGVELRPLLRVKKRELENYLREEGESFREDATNFNGRFLRSRIRLELMPILEGIFPKAVDHLVKAALDAQAQAQAGPQADDKQLQAQGAEALFGMAGIAARRAHWEAIAKELSPGKRGEKKPTELHLPGGWKLQCELPEERWVLERAALKERIKSSKLQ